MRSQRKRIDELALSFGIEFRQKLHEFMDVVVVAVGEVVCEYTGSSLSREKAMAEVKRRIESGMKWNDSPSDVEGGSGR